MNMGCNEISYIVLIYLENIFEIFLSTRFCIIPGQLVPKWDQAFSGADFFLSGGAISFCCALYCSMTCSIWLILMQMAAELTLQKTQP